MTYEFITPSVDSLLIERTDNGYVLSWLEEGGDGTVRVEREVIEDSDEMEGNMEVMTRLLEQVAEHFGYVYNKYGEHNLNITWDKKGHKLD